jgi:ribosomal protein L7/L12/DNA-directed RNA polymerase subunit RPC12/RpoP
MAETFNCSTCGAPLTISGDSATIRCPYCSNTVIVPETLRGGSPDPTPVNSAPDPAQIQEIIAIARSGNKIEAIKRYRQLTEVGLKEAKDTVEALAEGRPVEIHPVRTTPANIEEDILQLVRSGNKIEAIKRYREVTDVSLAEAKAAVEAIAEGRSVEIRPAQVLHATADEALADLIRRGKKIEAIKRYREQTGLGLKEAKDAVEAMEATQTWGNVVADQGAAMPQVRSSIPTPPPVLEDGGSSQMVGCVTKILVAIIVLAILAGCLTPVFIWLFSFGGR